MKQVVVKNDLAAAKKPEEAILEAVRRFGYGENCTFAIKLALEEAVTNAFRHGNQKDPDKHITVRYEIDATKILIEIEDEGPGFDPGDVPDPTLPEYIDRPHGRGIMLMRAYLDTVEYIKGGCAVRLEMFRKE